MELDYLNDGDIEQVADLEKLCFPEDAWPAEIYRDELDSDQEVIHLVVRTMAEGATNHPEFIIANAGVDLLGNVAYITTLATHPKWRRRRIGEYLLLNLLQIASTKGATSVALHVRASNKAAVQLYHKNGFEAAELVEGYYGDEPALLLTLKGLDGEAISRRLEGWGA